MNLTHRFAICLLPVFCLILHAQPLDAQGQVWSHVDRSMTSLVRDVRASATGDTLTVVLSVATNVNSQNQVQLNKTTGADADGSGSFSGAAGAGELSADYSTSSNRSFSNNASLRNNNTVEDRFAVRVLDVQSNGNLIVGGTREVQVDGDRRILVLSGIVARRDISPGNLVQSQYIHKLRVRYASAGSRREYTRQGWLTRKMNKVWPF